MRWGGAGFQEDLRFKGRSVACVYRYVFGVVYVLQHEVKVGWDGTP